MKPNQANPPDFSPNEKIPPDLLEWARQTFDKEDFLAQVREVEATGGFALEDFIAELETRMQDDGGLA